jgi:hypothetical protein
MTEEFETDDIDENRGLTDILRAKRRDMLGLFATTGLAGCAERTDQSAIRRPTENTSAGTTEPNTLSENADTTTTQYTEIDLGNPESEQSHAVETRDAEQVEMTYPVDEATGDVGRRIVPSDDEQGSIAFDANVSPDQQNYVTVRIWGNEKQ